MTSRFLPFFLLAAFQFVAPSVFAGNSAVAQRVEASFLLATGRLPSASELTEWSEENASATVSQLVEKHRKRLQGSDTARAVAEKAYSDAFGTAPEAASVGGDQRGAIYVELVGEHVARLRQQSDLYRSVLDRAYQRVVRRAVYDEEVTYWTNFDVLPYSLVVGCVDNWSRRNQPGLMVTVGTPTISLNSVYLSTVRLSPEVAEEARAVAGLETASTDDFHYASARTVIAAGAEKIVSDGRIHFVLAAAPGAVRQ